MGEPMTPTPTPQEVLAYFDAYAEGRMTPERARLRIEFALSAYQQEVERLTKERDDWKLATDQFQGMWSDAEARAAVAKRAAFVEAAQMARVKADIDIDGGWEAGYAAAARALAAKLAAQAVPPGFCASCTPDIRPHCESASWCMRPQAVPPGATEE
jgi:hypothetical protein